MTTRQIYLKQSDYSTRCVHLVPDFSIVAPHCVELGPQKWVHFHHFARGKVPVHLNLAHSSPTILVPRAAASAGCHHDRWKADAKGRGDALDRPRSSILESQLYGDGGPSHSHPIFSETYLDIFRHIETSKHWLVREKLTSGRFRSRQGVPRLVGGPSHCWVVNVKSGNSAFSQVWIHLGTGACHFAIWPVAYIAYIHREFRDHSQVVHNTFLEFDDQSKEVWNCCGKVRWNPGGIWSHDFVKGVFFPNDSNGAKMKGCERRNRENYPRNTKNQWDRMGDKGDKRWFTQHKCFIFLVIVGKMYPTVVGWTVIPAWKVGYIPDPLISQLVIIFPWKLVNWPSTLAGEPPHVRTKHEPSAN